MPDKRSLKKKNRFNTLLAYLYNKIHVNDAVKNFFTDLFIKIAFFKSYKDFEKELQSIDAAEKKQQIQSALNSKNVAIATIGLGFGYMGINFSQFLLALFTDVGYKGIGAAIGIGGSLILAGIVLPIALYLWASRLQSRALFLKNLAYEESKSKYNKEIDEQKKIIKKLFTAQFTAQFLAKRTFLLNEKFATKHAETLFKIHNYIENDTHKKIENAIDKTIAQTDQQFDSNHAKLISYYKMQSYLEPLKKFTRAMMLFTAIFALEAANLMFSGFLIPSIVGASLFAILDFKSKEMDHDLKLRRKHEHLIALKKLAIELGNNKELLNDFKPVKGKPTPDYNTPWGYKAVDYFLAGIGLTSAYVAISLVTIFSFHEMDMFKGQPLFNIGLGGLSLADALLFGAAGIFALGIAIWTIVETRKQYQFYENEKQRLAQEINILVQENEYLIKKRGCQTPKSSDLTMSGSLKALTKDGKNDLDISEGIKKSVRVFVYLLIFLGTTGGLVASPFVIAMIVFAVLVGVLDYLVRRNKSNIEDEISGLKMQQLHLLNRKTEILASYNPINDKTLQSEDGSKYTHTSAPQIINTHKPCQIINITPGLVLEPVNGSHSATPVSEILATNLDTTKGYFNDMRATMQPTKAADTDPSLTVSTVSSPPSPRLSHYPSVKKSILAQWKKTKLHLITPLDEQKKPVLTLAALDLAQPQPRKIAGGT